MRNLSTTWFKHLPKDEQDEFAELVRSNTRVLSRLLDILTENLDTLEIKEVKEDTYRDPSWAFYQAHLNGKRAAYKEIRKLLEFMED